ncbi:MAG TPA: hypothetical protein VK723_02475 [Thermoplasmata archaeon]|nr:hypothetical protein [Thermoplasmata archaeon]
MELVNRESYVRGLLRVFTLVVILSVLWALALVIAFFYPTNLPQADLPQAVASGVFLVIAVTEKLRAVPRVIVLEGGSLRVRYAIGTTADRVPDIREAVFFSSTGLYRRRSPAAGASVVYLNLTGGRTRKLGILDDAVAKGLIEDLALAGCDVKTFVEGRPLSEFPGAGHHPAT